MYCEETTPDYRTKSAKMRNIQSEIRNKMSHGTCNFSSLGCTSSIQESSKAINLVCWKKRLLHMGLH